MDNQPAGSGNSRQILMVFGIIIAIVLVGVAIKFVFAGERIGVINQSVAESEGVRESEELREIVRIESTSGAFFSETIIEGDSLVLQNEYILPDSGRTYYTQTDLRKLSREQLRIARNEIYAKHGRLFKDESLQAYFNGCSWYVGTVRPNDFNEDVLNIYEKANVKMILDFETKMGY